MEKNSKSTINSNLLIDWIASIEIPDCLLRFVQNRIKSNPSWINSWIPLAVYCCWLWLISFLVSICIVIVSASSMFSIHKMTNICPYYIQISIIFGISIIFIMHLCGFNGVNIQFNNLREKKVIRNRRASKFIRRIEWNLFSFYLPYLNLNLY